MTLTRIAFRLLIAAFLALVVVGLFNVREIPGLFTYLNARLGGYMVAVFYGAIFLFFTLSSLFTALMIEAPLYNSGDKVALRVSGFINRMRDSWPSLIGGTLIASTLHAFAAYGFACIMCA